jgi:hypothetical protein
LSVLLGTSARLIPSHSSIGSSEPAALPAVATAAQGQSPSSPVPAAAKRRAASAYAKLPLSFIPNAGQTDRSVRYYAQRAGYSLYFTQHKAVLALQKGKRGEALDLRFLGANPNARLIAADRASGKVNYFTGSEKHTNLPTYGRLVYRSLWPGIDMVFRGEGARLDYEFRLRPGAKVSDIRLAYAGAEGVLLGARGSLRIQTPLGALKDAPPQTFQRIDGRRVPVGSRYALSDGSYGFAIGRHDQRHPLLIDPSLAYSTFLGPARGLDIAVDAAGAAYVTGDTISTDFPTTAGAFDNSLSGEDAFVSKLSPAGSRLDYSTYLGGSNSDDGSGIAVDSAGAAYVTGITSSSNFPTTTGAFDTSYNGGGDAFVAKLDPAGNGLAYSTYLGGSSFDGLLGDITVDAAGAAYVTGSTLSANFPTTAGAFDTSFNGGAGDAFVTKLNPAGSSLNYSTYLGGSSGVEPGRGIAVDSVGAAYVTGFTASSNFPTTTGAFDTSYNGGGDAFVAKLDPAGNGLAYSTYLGGSDSDDGLDIAVDSAGAAYVTGDAGSTNFPTTAGAFDTSLNRADGFVTKLNPSGSGLDYSTYLGGSAEEEGFGIAVDLAGAAYVTGVTNSTDFPTTPGAFDTSFNGSFFGDAFVTKLNPAGSELAYSTFLGGSEGDSGHGIAVDSGGAAYVTGITDSSNFPTTAGAFDTSPNSTFVTKLVPGPPPTTPRCKVTNGGQITAANGDRASFGGNSQSNAAANVQGQQQYQDHGPAQPMRVQSIRITALTCNQARTQASIFGEATIDGTGTHQFQIDLEDLGEPGKGADTYRIQLDTGYDSGVQTLQGGTVQIRNG